MQPVDVEYAAKWGKEHGSFRIEQLFNGGGSAAYQADQTSGIDPLLAEFQKKPETKKPISSFGWINHTYDHPNLDIGCATQNYVEAELAENTTGPPTTPGSTREQRTAWPTETQALGNDNPTVFVTGRALGLREPPAGQPGDGRSAALRSPKRKNQRRQQARWPPAATTTPSPTTSPTPRRASESAAVGARRR